MFFKDPFSLVPVNQIADIADKFTRSEILSSNELRAIVGFKPVDDPKADELRNSNLNQSADAPPPASTDPNAQQEAMTDEGGQEMSETPQDNSAPDLPPEIIALVNKIQNEGGNR